MVYVLNIDSKPLMPCTETKARHLLKGRKAVIVNRTPFTIRLKFAVSDNVEPVSLGVDAGSKTIGLSATTDKKVLFEAEVEVRNDITKLLEARREKRSLRRNRTTRYRKPRFDNRVHSKNKGWLAPSVEAKIQSHIRVVEDVMKLLPITKIVIETAAFDIQKIKNPEIEGEQYQKGEQLDFWNVREYVLWRDGHTCRHCKGKSNDNVLNVHHIRQRKNAGSDRPENLVTLCKTCHKAYHKGEIKLNLKKAKNYRYEAFMGIMRWKGYGRLKAIYGDMVSMTFGYITKHTRISNGLEKAHRVDARCISGNPASLPPKEWFAMTKKRCHNRKLHKETILKGGLRKSNQCPKEIYGFRLFDKVKANGQLGYVHGRRMSGSFDVRSFDGDAISKSISYKKLTLVERSNILMTRRLSVSSPS